MSPGLLRFDVTRKTQGGVKKSFFPTTALKWFGFFYCLKPKTQRASLLFISKQQALSFCTVHHRYICRPWWAFYIYTVDLLSDIQTERAPLVLWLCFFKNIFIGGMVKGWRQNEYFSKCMGLYFFLKEYRVLVNNFNSIVFVSLSISHSMPVENVIGVKAGGSFSVD